ncbi:MAG: septum formation initiator family protein [Acidimicrobiales bacterium]
MSNTRRVKERTHSQWMLPLAVVTAVAMLVVWFPISALWNQQREIDVAAAQLRAVQHQEKLLSSHQKVLDSKATVIQLAREQYQLVAPGQSLIQVLPGSPSAAGAPSFVDPGNQPLVEPATVTPLVSATSAMGHASKGFFARLLRTLEFWR